MIWTLAQHLLSNTLLISADDAEEVYRHKARRSLSDVCILKQC